MTDLKPVNSSHAWDPAVQEPFSGEESYELLEEKIRYRDVQTALRFLEYGVKKGPNYQLPVRNEKGKYVDFNSIKKTDCSGMAHRILFNGFEPKDRSAHGYFMDAYRKKYLIKDPLKNLPQPGDVYFQDANQNSSKEHMGIVENCWSQGSGLYCAVINASGNEKCPNPEDPRCRVVRDLIHRDEAGMWQIDYNNNSNGKFNKTFGQDAIHFADSIKMRGIPTKEEMNPLGGVDLDAALPLESQDLGLGELQGFRVSADGSMLTLYAWEAEASSEESVNVRGINPADLLEMLKSFQRTGGLAPAFTLLPSKKTAVAADNALKDAGAASRRQQFSIAPSDVDSILYGKQVWDFLGISEPNSFPMRAIFSDPNLKDTHAGQVLMESDVLLKTLMFGELGTTSPTPYLKRSAEAAAESAGKGGQTDPMEFSRIWFQVNPESFVIREVKDTDGSVVYDFEDVRLQVECLAVAPGGISGIHDTGEACGDLSQWYTNYLNENLEEIAEKHPVLLELKELYKAAALAKIVYQKGVRLSDVTPDQGPLWETKKSVPFYPILYIGSLRDDGRIPSLMGVGGGGVFLDIPIDKVVREGVFDEDSFYKNPLKAPIGNVEDGVRAVRFKIGQHPKPEGRRKFSP